jgi:bacillithiol synthase
MNINETKSSTEDACSNAPEAVGLRVEGLAFARIPDQSKLFLNYLRDPVGLHRFYPSAVRFHHELAARIPEVLARHEVNRKRLCDALEKMNRSWEATEETLRNIERLRSSKCAAIVTGQQAGLFTGPLYTIYKALSAVKLAACLEGRGIEVVPVFWMATEDHDFAEVRAAEFIACDGRLASVQVASAMHRENSPVGHTILDDSIEDTIRQLLDTLPATQFTPDVEQLLREAYQPGRAYGEAFARMMTALVGRFGLILLDPLDVELKQLAAPLYAEAARRAPEIASAITERSRKLESENYHAQVFASANSFSLFLHADGARRALTRVEGDTSDPRYRAKSIEGSWTIDELAKRAESEPENFSPNVTLRAVVQDYLLPTVAYFGGAAEVAYFAQTSEVYRVLNRPATPILHRASLTLVEHRTGRTLERYNLRLEDFLAGIDSVTARVVEKYLGEREAQTFNETEQIINEALEKLKAQFSEFDSTLAAALATGQRKINYQLETMRARFHRAQIERDRTAHRQLERAFAQLYPEKTLQERRINVTSLIARHGHYVLDWIHNAIDISSIDHQIVYL